MDLNSKKYTIFGFMTILIWGTSSVFTRNLSTGLGAFTAAALVNLIGGILVLSVQFKTGKGIKDWKRVSPWYWPVCGFLFILYTSSSYIAMSLASSDKSVIMLVLICFLWPLFTLILTIPILKEKASPWLIVGVLLSLTGIVTAKLGYDIFDLPEFVGNLAKGRDLPVYLIGFVNALSWGLYTNFTKKFVGEKKADGVGLYMIGAGIILGTLAVFSNEPRNFTPATVVQLIYAAVVVTCIANILWNLSINRGDMVIVVLASNFLPIISTVMASLLLGVPITMPIIVGSLLVVAGTSWSKRCFRSVETSENL